MVRIFNARGMITSHQHIEAQIPGDVRVIVDEQSDQYEAAATLRRIAEWIEGEAELAKKPFDPNNPIP